jgi:predicted TIM-barrel fold metal-dependent hydrolase
VIIDCHVHVNPPADGERPGEYLLPFADRMGIDKLCLSRIDGNQQPTPEQIEAANDLTWDAVRAFPDRFIGFCYLNPCYLYHSLEEVERCLSRGPFGGIKLWVSMWSDQPNLDPIAERAAELGVPVLQHTWIKITGNLPFEPEPRHLAALAERHPDTRFIMAHSGGNWERGYKTIAHLPNVYGELAGGDPEMGQAEMAVRLLGPDRVVWGSDAVGRSFASQLAKVTGADLAEEDKAAILGGNMERLLPL